MVDEERRQADREHGGREEEEEDVELGLSVREAVLGVGPGAGQRSAQEQGAEQQGCRQGPPTSVLPTGEALPEFYQSSTQEMYPAVESEFYPEVLATAIHQKVLPRTQKDYPEARRSTQEFY